MSQFISTSNVSIAADCPRCGKPLIDPQGLGWCKACGYCHSLAESEKKAASEPGSQPTTMSATGSAVAQLPAWMWIALAGVMIIVGSVIAFGRYVPLKPLDRALVTTVASAVGLLLMLLGQFVGLMRIAPEDPSLTFKDVVFPFRLYGIIFKRLPSTQFTLYLGVWALALIISVNVCVGGVGHWLTYLPKTQQKK